MSYSVTILRKAQKELAELPVPAFETVEQKLLGLRDNPRPFGCKKLKGPTDIWRVRSGDYRILYEIDDSAGTVTIIKIGHRGSVYR
ncbi:MAG: type II toxin-antitoxin system RelE/ParE family toxin [Candidatus Acidiferrum sp.]